MSFVPKDWKDFPNTTTPITAAALEDLETRVTDYSDDGFIPAGDVDAIEVVTQAAYDGLTPVATTLYVIVG